mmetsp:Transcript_36577/g.112712  ORF Transcript_36577/g.112712 Transcript_36577/m.112712 type:complete len:228 (-) Transcript_36577:96-779(-)
MPAAMLISSLRSTPKSAVPSSSSPTPPTSGSAATRSDRRHSHATRSARDTVASPDDVSGTARAGTSDTHRRTAQRPLAVTSSVASMGPFASSTHPLRATAARLARRAAVSSSAACSDAADGTDSKTAENSIAMSNGELEHTMSADGSSRRPCSRFAVCGSSVALSGVMVAKRSTTSFAGRSASPARVTVCQHGRRGVATAGAHPRAAVDSGARTSLDASATVSTVRA